MLQNSENKCTRYLRVGIEVLSIEADLLGLTIIEMYFDFFVCDHSTRSP